MPRKRTTLTEHPNVDLRDRGRPAIGLDFDFPTPGPHGDRPAVLAERTEPTPGMVDLAREVLALLASHGAIHARVTKDRSRRGHPGALLVAWTDGPTALEVARHFAVSTSECGTPRVPSWLALRRDHDFDMRWQPEFL